MIEAEKFLTEDVQQLKKGSIAYILIYEIIFPKSPYKILLSGKQLSEEEWKKMGFVIENGKLKRDGRIFYSSLMVELENWAEKHNLKIDFYPPRNDKAAGTVVVDQGTFMIITGDIKPEYFDEEPWNKLNKRIYVE